MMVRQLLRPFARLAIVALAVVAFTSIANPHPAAAAVNFFGDSCQGAAADSAACSGSDQDNISGTNGIILRAAGMLAIVASISAVIVIMVAGIIFITAGGDSSKISNARQMIIYSIVGLIVIFLARTIVVFVVNNV